MSWFLNVCLHYVRFKLSHRGSRSLRRSTMWRIQRASKQWSISIWPWFPVVDWITKGQEHCVLVAWFVKGRTAACTSGSDPLAQVAVARLSEVWDGRSFLDNVFFRRWANVSHVGVSRPASQCHLESGRQQRCACSRNRGSTTTMRCVRPRALLLSFAA